MKFNTNYNNPFINFDAYERDMLLSRQDLAIFQQSQELRETKQVKRTGLSPENDGSNKRHRPLMLVTKELFFKHSAETMTHQEIGFYVEKARETGSFNDVEDLILILFLKTGNYDWAQTLLSE